MPTPTVERQLLGQLSEVYAGYFASLSNRAKNAEAFRAIERARGRVEAQALEDHEPVAPHEPTTAEKALTNLNLRLLDTDDLGSRQDILQTIYDTEQQINPNFKPDHFSTEPVNLIQLQRDLGPSELILEYVLDEPNSYVLAITETTVKRYALKAKSELEREAADYRTEVMKRKVDDGLAPLFEYLVRSGLAESTLVVLTSDHGEMGGDHWLLEKLGFWDESYHVPLIVVDPRAEADGARGTIVEAVTESVDVLPTMRRAVELVEPLEGTVDVLGRVADRLAMDGRGNDGGNAGCAGLECVEVCAAWTADSIKSTRFAAKLKQPKIFSAIAF